ncbi:MAG: branched-chain-amino-acid transaminase [Myxococcota bacterium]|nr:branched-chain-amino-acid transaminase [Myxococcales bacterium]
MKVWIDGRIVEAADARVSVTDHGLLYGDGVFEGMRVYHRRVFRLADHLRRFRAGLDAIGLALPGGIEGVEKAVLETARAYGRDEAYLRLVATRGAGGLGVDPTLCERPTLFCIADAIRLYDAAKLARGIDLVTVSVRRPAADALDPRVKSLNYLNSVLAKREARLRGADEGLILNAQGLVAEAAVANVFTVRDGVLTTPPPSDGCLEGITRASVLELAARLGIAAREASLGRFDLFAADEVFLTGSGARIVPVGTFDGAVVGLGGRGPVTQRIDDAFGPYTKERGTAF